jgi:hypothetical protein
VLVLEGMAQEALDRPTDAIESYRRAMARGLQSQDVATRLEKLEHDAADRRPQTAIAEAPTDVSRQ